ncbi:SMP-30/gluconolactonase/LRE family protein [Streptomyces hainanensis]|uniref:SMP-30/Gluconolactonase/LRE-like region domain-containing protein n=1 Tax=Streptomyces hainanensis TaxID=402648 RepID=A0A4R4T8V2_9ACTN|nr:SMP-30/gluconolactonase/LRE family protein [Streptomyces hainanensis]TDC73688.1 hypothetical protein E1283_18410 [Streptomyces hainanensis]
MTTSRSRRVHRTALAVSAAGLLLTALQVPATAVGHTAGDRHGRHCPADEIAEAVTSVSPELYPEGVAWDPTREAFLVTSTRQGNVSVVTPDGAVEELTPSIGLVSTLGIKVDTRRNRAIVSYTDYWVRRMLPGVEQPPTSGVAIIDLRTGELLQRIDTGQGRENTFANDLAYDTRTGTVYVTDSVSATIQQIDTRGRVSDLVTDERFAADFIGLNGIAWHPDGYLLTTRYDTGEMFKVSLRGRPRVTQVEVPQSLIGVDGITLRADGTLLAVQNELGAGLGMPRGDTAVTSLASRDGWRTAYVTGRTDPWAFPSPTTITDTPSGAYAVSGQVDVLMSGVGSADTFWLQRAGF